MRTIWFAVFLFMGGVLAAQEYAVSSIPSSLLKHANTIVRASEQRVEFLSYKKLKYSREIAITILNESGISNAYYPVFYSKGTKVTRYDAELRDASGNVIKKYKTKDVRDESVNSQGALFNDRRVQYLNIVPVSYPFTMVYSIEYTTSNTLHIPFWKPVSDYNLGVESSSYKMVNQTSILIRKKENGFEFTPIDFTQKGDGFEYSVKNISPLRDEILSPPLDEITPIVRFTPEEFELEGVKGKFDNWEQFGQWYYKNLLKDKSDLSKEEKNRAVELVEGVSDPVEKVRILYQYLQSKTRYINVAIGIGGWEPYPASYVSERSYGDCKALSNYMVSLLDAVGIEGYHTIVYGEQSRRQDMDKDFASLQGNHMIVNVPLEEETLWLECTSQDTAFNYLGRFTDDRWAVSVGPDGGKVVRTQDYPAEQNLEKVKGTAKLNADGELRAEFTITASGLQYSSVSFVDFEESRKQREFLHQYFSGMPNFHLENYAFDNDRDQAVFTMELKFKLDPYAKSVGQSLALNVIPFGRVDSSIKKDDDRRFPVEIRFGYTDVLEFDLDIPTGYRMHEAFQEKVISNEFGEYSLTVQAVTPEKLTIKRELRINDGQYPAEKFNDYVDFRRKVTAFDNSKILLENK